MPEPYFDEDDHAPMRFGAEHRERWRERENIREGTPAGKRRHHFVPRMWLRNWADPATGAVEVMDVARAEGFRARPTNIMLVNDLYRVGTEVSHGNDMGPEEAYSRIEGAGAAAMKTALAGDELTDEQRYDLALLIAVQHLRVPEVIATAVPDDPVGVKEAIEVFAAEMLAKPDGLPPVEFSQSARGRSTHELARALLDGYPEFEAVERGFGFWNLLEGMHHLAGRVYRRQWTIWTTRSILLIGDDPVPTRPLGGTFFKANGSTHVVDTPAPIGPHTLMLIGNRPDGAGALDNDLAEHYATVSNEIQMDRANRFLVGPPAES